VVLPIRRKKMARDPKEWEGCFTAVVTPFKENGDLDRDAFCENIELLITEGGHGVIVSGCTGESWALSDEEKKELFNLTVAQAKGRVTVIGGTGEITPNHTIKLTQYAQEAGMDGVMITAPARVIPNDREIITYYQAVSDAVGMPILVYNIPKRQGVDLTPELVSRLADIKNVAAIKESSNDYIRVLEDIRLAADRIRVFTGHSAERGVPAIAMGAVGWVGSNDTQIMGKEAIDMFNLAKQGELEKARETQYRCITLDKGLRGGQAGTFPAFLKYAMNLRNRPGGYPRKPVCPPTEEQKNHIRGVLHELDLL
jgi:4-hydroxy-tetrahydrodipicolinate synthase